LASNLEELVRESDCALDAYENFSDPLAYRASAKRLRKEKGVPRKWCSMPARQHRQKKWMWEMEEKQGRRKRQRERGEYSYL